MKLGKLLKKITLGLLALMVFLDPQLAKDASCNPDQSFGCRASRVPLTVAGR